MATIVEYLVCPICGKTTPTKTGSYKIGDPTTMGLIQIRECRGKKGFCTIETKTMRDNLPEYQKFADELVDFCSGILMVTMEENLHVHKPVFILKYVQLQKKVERLVNQGTPEADENTFRVDDLNRENKELKEKIWRIQGELDDIRINQPQPTTRRVAMRRRLTTDIGDNNAILVDDLRRENDKLKKKIIDKNRIIRMHEDASLQ